MGNECLSFVEPLTKERLMLMSALHETSLGRSVQFVKKRKRRFEESGERMQVKFAWIVGIHKLVHREI